MVGFRSKRLMSISRSDNMPEISWYKYVQHNNIQKYLELNWSVISELPCHHGIYCVLMLYNGVGEPILPI